MSRFTPLVAFFAVILAACSAAEPDEQTVATEQSQAAAHAVAEADAVEPVVEEGAETRTLYLPQDAWIHLWSGKAYTGGEVTVFAPIGEPPVFYRAGSADAALFDGIVSA